MATGELLHQRRRSPAEDGSSSSHPPASAMDSSVTSETGSISQTSSINNGSSSPTSHPRGKRYMYIYSRYALCCLVVLLSLLSFLSYHEKLSFVQARAMLLVSSQQHQEPKGKAQPTSKRRKRPHKNYKFTEKWPTSHDLTSFIQGPAAPFRADDGNENLIFPMAQNQTLAVCEFQDLPFSAHFPHAMQQLLRCFSWWQANPHQRPVLVMPLTPLQKKYHYTNSLLQAFRNVWKVKIFKKKTPFHTPFQNSSVNVNVNTGSFPFQMRSLEDAVALRDGILEHYRNDLNHTLGVLTDGTNVEVPTKDIRIPPGCPSSTNPKKALPTIGFLNRKGGRNVTNYRAILQALHEELHLPTTPPSIRYLDSFDGLDFLEQLSFFSDVDIVIGPHGAQFTSIFMTSTCGGLLELFPKGLWWVSFFGTLATVTGHHHASLYTGSQDPLGQANETRYYQSTQTLRIQSRNFAITAPPEQVVEQVRQLIAQWQSCCESMANDVSAS